MQFLNKEIEALTKKRKTSSLIKKKEVSCGIFQNYDAKPYSPKTKESKD
ncbi:hypothetical protein [Maribacter sp. 2210JD10-5]